jgi:hypothetical protein
MKVEVSEIVGKMFVVVIGLIFIIIGIFIPRTEVEQFRAVSPDLTDIFSFIFSLFFKAPWYIVKIFLIFIGLSFIALIVLVTYT